ncbi:four helix bundle protein [Bacteroidetes/Chlorobi group bacterium ChocPot_Mid]|nr:MAG: four helix bundle protein [Bacteroidetes/Chlorobi group bacterium ChocPot_Mid]
MEEVRILDNRNNLYQKALEFSKELVIVYRELSKNGIEKELLNQVLRSGTSIGVNIAEAQGSNSENDYLSKIHIAFNEALETRFWIELLFKTGDINSEKYNLLESLLTEIQKILYSMIKGINIKKEKQILKK